MANFDPVQILVSQNKLSQDNAQKILNEANVRRVNTETILLERNLISEDDLLKLKSDFFNLPMKIFEEKEIIPREILLIIPQESAKYYQMISFGKDDKFLYVGMVNPSSSEAQNALKFIAQGLGLSLKVFVIKYSDFLRYLKSYTTFGEEVTLALSQIKQQVEGQVRTTRQKSIIDLDQSVVSSSEEAPIIKLVSDIIRNAVNQRASDIHIEPERNRLRVRYRIDGDLASVLFLPKEIHPSVLTRVKILSNLKIDETRIPQDGRFSALISGKQIDFRVSTFPTANDEKVAIRILDPSIGLKTIDDLGVSSLNLEKIKQAMKKPFGMILVTGPTGSGKTTTLYAILQILSQDSTNVVTLEDPIEYFISGVNQSQVLPEIGYTFASGLRSILRQDPDIIMVGEIRDSETAELAVHSALTGHIMLSTLHTNNAIGAIPRLIDLGVQKFLIPPTLNIIVSQRLVRKLCNNCKKAVKANSEQEKLIDQALANLPIEFRKTLNYSKPYTIYEPVGCEVCKNKGFLGRTGIYEVLQMTSNLEKIILQNSGESSILEEAQNQKMIDLRAEAILHLLEGIIPFSEVIRETASND
ncbi:MAG TPA: GspE/PulE family protein [Candidatus Paceibacterota bacterium]|jgi:type IV pilus assembly protein PilB|nr:GspE/PulE family protein [Candidatus Paceibacterota bacterium]